MLKWTKNCVGTVHTFQGKDANEVLLVLGCSNKSAGAMNWVVKKANILNVACTRAKEKDIPRILKLLEQVLQIHADIRPDIFIPGTTKYTIDELREILKNKEKPIFVAVDEADVCVGYAFCQLQEQPVSNNMVPFKSFYIDDLCVDQEARGQHIGESLFEHVKKEAKQRGCYEVTLNVWTGNTSAEKFYERMGMRTKKRQMEYTDL